MGKKNRNNQSDHLAKDLLDELLEDSGSVSKSSDPSLNLPTIDLEDGSIDDVTIETNEFSSTHPLEAHPIERTEKLEDEDLTSGTQPLAETPPPLKSPSKPQKRPQERAAVGRAEPLRAVGSADPTEMALAQSENLRLAQDRILELEKEIERLRLENEELGAAGETLKRRADELVSSNEEYERKLEHEVSTSSQEKEILRNSRDLLRKEVEELKQKNAELELRISTNIQRVRVRERELENRLELMKVESKALIRSKDEMILDLKRQIDQLNLELNNYRVKSQDLNKQISARQETLRRTVKALRLALSMMEGDDERPLKKAK
ncbi:MAG TPA: hypothetical protein DCL41_01600 [Bdellovibrionales bacterium]|nr:hypothetical protein [Bdellovibrionales bacterium]|tara:strand:+ start:214 stop:1176 length:963 start_codon:yes stop_codon:yes gene_type:complete